MEQPASHLRRREWLAAGRHCLGLGRRATLVGAAGAAFGFIALVVDLAGGPE